MFTSRAEYRLQLREDNADLRLTEIGRGLGLVDDLRWDLFCRKRDALDRERERLKSTWVHPGLLPAADGERLLGKAIEREYSLAELMKRPNVSFDQLVEVEQIAQASGVRAAPVSRETLIATLGPAMAAAVIEQIEIEIKYAGYINKQSAEIERAAGLEDLALPPDFDYNGVKALSIEVRQKLSRQRPETLGQASRISGVTPAAVSLLLVHLKKRGRRPVDRNELAVEAAQVEDAAADDAIRNAA
jgi:tRNA uridine 5-carboxymethylaminomethyl modification enzyme